MKQQKILAARYAQALFELSKESGELNAVEEQLNQFSSMIQGNEELSRLFANPMYSPAQRSAVVKELGQKLSWDKSLNHFVLLLIDKGRSALIQDVAEEFTSLSDIHHGRVHVTVTAPRALSDDFQKELREKLQAQIGKEVNLHVQEDQSLIGGMVLQMGDTMLDNSLKSRLNEMREQLIP